MKKIFKYQWPSSAFGPVDVAMFHIPKEAKILSAREQNSSICIWAIVDTSKELEMRTFRIVGTGHEVPDTCTEHLGTAFFHSGTLVLHVFEDIGGDESAITSITSLS